MHGSTSLTMTVYAVCSVARMWIVKHSHSVLPQTASIQNFYTWTLNSVQGDTMISKCAPKDIFGWFQMHLLASKGIANHFRILWVLNWSVLDQRAWLVLRMHVPCLQTWTCTLNPRVFSISKSKQTSLLPDLRFDIICSLGISLFETSHIFMLIILLHPWISTGAGK